MESFFSSILQEAPLDVPAAKRAAYLRNIKLLTKNTGRLFIFPGDQRVEHLNDDFYGPNIPRDDADPEHLFRIAASSRIGAFAAQMGLIARYGKTYSKVPYIIKLNSKTNIVADGLQDPYSSSWYDVREVQEFLKNSKLNILGVGYTVYIGSSFESAMLREAAQIVYQAHQAGLPVILWMYPRGKSVTNKFDPHVIAGAVNVGSALGADFVKVNRPHGVAGEEAYAEIISAAGRRTGVIFAGGEAMSVDDLLSSVYLHVHRFGAAGAALGRNIHQHPLKEAIGLANAIAAIVYEGQAPEAARRALIKN